MNDEDIILNYGMAVSAVHDPRYYNKDDAEQGFTPDTCQGEEKEALIRHYGEQWKDLFWGADYYTKFPK